MNKEDTYLYNSENRRELIKKYKIISSIDRVKLTLDLNRFKNVFCNNFKNTPYAKFHRPRETGVYALLTEKKAMNSHKDQKPPILIFLEAIPEKTICTNAIKKKINEKYTTIESSSKLQKYKESHLLTEIKFIPHKEYKIFNIGLNESVLIIKTGRYLTISPNNVLQKTTYNNLEELIKTIVIKLIQTKLFNLNDEYPTPEKLIEGVLKNIKLSEIELAFDMNSEIGCQIYKNHLDHYKRSFDNKKEKLTNYKKTIYHSRQLYKKKSSWKYKIYNKTIKDEEDQEKKQPDGNFFKTETAMQVYRFEITIGREKFRDKLLEKKGKTQMELVKLPFPDLMGTINSLDLLATPMREFCLYAGIKAISSICHLIEVDINEKEFSKKKSYWRKKRKEILLCLVKKNIWNL